MIVKYKKIIEKEQIIINLFFPSNVLFFDIPYLKINYLKTEYYIPPENFEKNKKIRFLKYVIPKIKSSSIKILNNFNDYCYYIFNNRKRKIEIKLKRDNV